MILLWFIMVEICKIGSWREIGVEFGNFDRLDYFVMRSVVVLEVLLSKGWWLLDVHAFYERSVLKCGR